MTLGIVSFTTQTSGLGLFQIVPTAFPELHPNFIAPCSIPQCSHDPDHNYQCRIGNNSLRSIGIAEIQPSSLHEPITWAVGVSQKLIDPNISNSTYFLDRTYYLGAPKSRGPGSLDQRGCAVFLEGVAANVTFPETKWRDGTGNCSDVLEYDCQKDLLDQARLGMGKLLSNSGFHSPTICDDIVSYLRQDVPPSCYSNGRQSLDLFREVISKELFSQNDFLTVDGDCRPTTKSDYGVNQVAGYRRIVENDTASIDRVVKGVTPLLSIFFNSTTANTAISNGTVAEALLTCLSTSGIPPGTAEGRNAPISTGLADSLKGPRSLAASICLVVLGVVFVLFV